MTSSIEQNRRRAVDAGEIFRLRHFERDGQRALLAFAAELRGGLVVQQHWKFVAMRADERGAIGAFASARLGEFHGEILFHARLIFEAQFLGVVGDAAIGQPRERRKFGDEFAAQADDFVAELDEFGGETFQRGFIERCAVLSSALRERSAWV